MTNEMHDSYNQFYPATCLSTVHVSNKYSLSSSGAQNSVLYYTVYYFVAPDDKRIDSFETCRVDKKKLWDKIDYKNCASRWSFTHSNMMHGTYNVRLTEIYFNMRSEMNDLDLGKTSTFFSFK
jgi:hypothetical protein